MTVSHYENFPVASLLLPPRLRRPVARIYAFARSADDIADEGEALSGERLAALDAYRKELDNIAAGGSTDHPIFRPLAEEIARHSLALSPFYDLLDAFAQDVVQHRYADYPALLDYCRRSANPVGRLMLALYGIEDELSLLQADAICTALQLTNFWQDVALDWGKGRIYLPQWDMQRFAVTPAHIAAARCDPPWQALMAFQIERTRQLMRQGAPLALRLPGRIGWELRLVIQGGLRILEKIQVIQGDVFRHRPVLSRVDWLKMLKRSLFMRYDPAAPIR